VAASFVVEGLRQKKEDCKIFIKNTQEEGGIEKLNSKKRDRGDQWHLNLVFFGGFAAFSTICRLTDNSNTCLDEKHLLLVPRKNIRPCRPMPFPKTFS
jgi:hypothetical protein